jgi:hypothetical protein
MNIGQFIGFVVSFAILTLFSLRFTVALLRNISGKSRVQEETFLLHGKGI